MSGKYFYRVTPTQLYLEGGDSLPEIGPVLEFVEDAEHAHAQLFRRGFMLPYDDDIFTDDGARFKSTEFNTEEEEGLHNLLGALTDDKNPYSKNTSPGKKNIANMRFKTLKIERLVEPSVTGGKRKRRTVRRIKKRRNQTRK